MKTLGVPLQYACFACRKSFKRPQFAASIGRFMTSAQIEGQVREVEEFEQSREYKCPECGGPVYFMGKDFKAPRKSDARGWRQVQAFIGSGKVYYRGTSA
jgi:DNA-directed RNA polymerase subunit RPC12/RpoP